MNIISKIWNCIFRWKVLANRFAIANGNVIIGLAFGMRKDDPGESNKAMATIVKRLCAENDLPAILQWEIADCLPAFPEKFVVRKHIKPDTYLDTYEVLRQAHEICKKNKWYSAVIIAHPDHMWRVLMTAKKFGFKVIPVDTQSVPYDTQSSQPWTRSFRQFFPRETIARLLYVLKGWM